MSHSNRVLVDNQQQNQQNFQQNQFQPFQLDQKTAESYLNNFFSSLKKHFENIINTGNLLILTNTHSFFYPMILAGLLRYERSAKIFEKSIIYPFLLQLFKKYGKQKTEMEILQILLKTDEEILDVSNVSLNYRMMSNFV